MPVNNRVRIIGGQYRRRILRFPAPKASDFRPTPDRVRETLFNWLGQRLAGFSCLDLFAGSGALGFEAISRGAACVVMIERNPEMAGALRANARLLQIDDDTVEIICQDALEFIRWPRARRHFDVIFLDPPFRQGWLERLAPWLAPWTHSKSLLYVEAEYRIEAIGDWRCFRHGTAGQVHYHLLRQEPYDV